MRVRDLAYKCKDRGIECEGCPHEKICEKPTERLKYYSPYGLLTVLEEEISE